MQSKNILFISIAWPARGERNLYSDLIHEFLKKGHQVYVVCNDEQASHTHAEQVDGIHVLRVKSSKLRKAAKFQKAIALFTLGKKFKIELVKQYPDLHIDMILGHSPPITLSRLYGSLKRRYNAPVYYLLKDIWPDGPADLKIIRRNGLIYKYFRSHERRTYRTVDFIGCMSPKNVDYIRERNRFLPAEKVEVCPNTITPRKLSMDESKSVIRAKHNIPEDARIFIFSGNLGRAHGLDFYLQAIEQLKDQKDAFFLIGGSGQYFNFLEREIVARGITNIGIYSRLPAEEFDQLLQACDVGVVLLSASYTVPQFPSRLLAYLEAGLAVFCVVNRDTDIGSIVEKKRCGLSVIHGDMEAFKKAVAYFCEADNSEVIEKMGSNSLDLLHEDYSSENSYNIIMKHFVPKTGEVSHERD